MIELSARSFLEISEVKPEAMTELSEKNFLIKEILSVRPKSAIGAHG